MLAFIAALVLTALAVSGQEAPMPLEDALVIFQADQGDGVRSCFLTFLVLLCRHGTSTEA